jgi:hypothetical protein
MRRPTDRFSQELSDLFSGETHVDDLVRMPPRGSAPERIRRNGKRRPGANVPTFEAFEAESYGLRSEHEDE